MAPAAIAVCKRGDQSEVHTTPSMIVLPYERRGTDYDRQKACEFSEVFLVHSRFSAGMRCRSRSLHITLARGVEPVHELLLAERRGSRYVWWEQRACRGHSGEWLLVHCTLQLSSIEEIFDAQRTANPSHRRKLTYFADTSIYSGKRVVGAPRVTQEGIGGQTGSEAL